MSIKEGHPPRLVKCGELSRAAQVLISPGLAPANDETVEKLVTKHPKRSYEVKVTPSHVGQINLSNEHLLSVIRNSPRGSAAGPSGWRYEHFRALIENPISADSLLLVCSTIAQSSVLDSVCKLLSASRLIALPKSGGDVRPIAIGECDSQLNAYAWQTDFQGSLRLYNMVLLQRVVQSPWHIICSCYWSHILNG